MLKQAAKSMNYIQEQLQNVERCVMNDVAKMQNTAAIVLNKIEKLSSNIKSVSKISNLSYNRKPKLFVYNNGGIVDASQHDNNNNNNYDDNEEDEDDFAKHIFSELAMQNMLQIGDVIVHEKSYRGDLTFIVDRDGSMNHFLKGDSGFGVPACPLELGILNKSSLKNLLEFYGSFGAAFIIYPMANQKNHLDVSASGYVFKVWIHDGIHNVDRLLDMEHEEYFKHNNVGKAIDVFLKSSKNNVGTKCIEQTTKKYTDRPSPPFPASECPGHVKPGNNKKLYESVANVKGVYSWKLKKM